MSTKTKGDVLIEIGCEELPAKNLKFSAQTFLDNMGNALTHFIDIARRESDFQLPFEGCNFYATPRRLGLYFQEMTLQQPTQCIKKQGPTKALGLTNQGQWTPAALGFAASCGCDISDLTFQETDKCERLIFEKEFPGKHLKEVLADLLKAVLLQLPLGRRMRYSRANDFFEFIRPIHWIVLLIDDQPVQTEIFGIKTDRFSHGHRFHHPEPISIPHARNYEKILKQHFVIPDFEERRTFIQKELQRLAAEQQASPIIPEALLDEVTGLVEWPVVLMGSFKEDFLKLPKEVLTSTINTHQKCFALESKNQKLLPSFLTVSNIESKNAKTVIEGNECVIDARLSDAAFYYETDKKRNLEDYREDLKQVRFQEGLGTLWDKTERLTQFVTFFSEKIPESLKNPDGFSEASASKAAKLCKSDLLTQMVGEFPELQGAMGRCYALAQNIDPAVAHAIEEHYYPRFAQDHLPTSMNGSLLAIADRVDTLVGLFGIGKTPTGSKDPFSLRRQALGLIRLLVEKKIPMDLRDVFEYAASLYPANTLKNTIDNLLTFCMERLKSYLQEQGIVPSIFEAIANSDSTKNGLSITSPLDFYERSLALHDFLSKPEAPILIASNKRVKNILKDLPTSSQPGENRIAAHQLKNILQEPAEKNLLTCLEDQEKKLIPLLSSDPKQYTQALQSLATLATPLDQFFDNIMVMCEDPALRSSRLALLQRLRLLFLQIADFSFL